MKRKLFKNCKNMRIYNKYF